MWGNTDTHGSGWIGMLPIGETREHSGGINGSDNRTQVDPTDCEIMQFTGLKDKNDKEIYEGDILQWNAYGYISKRLETVKWFRSGWWYFDKEDALTTIERDVLAREVIGNIHENPELLK